MLIFAGCKTIYMPQKQHNFYIPTIDGSFEAFDIETFEKNPTRIINLEDKTIDRTSSVTSFQEVIYFSNSPFSILKAYYLNGISKMKGVLFNHGSLGIQKGIWYEYDQKGNLINEKNFEEGYTFTWEDVLNYCVTNNIPITLGYQPTSTYDTSIKKMYSKEFKRNVWKIIYPDTTGVGIGQGFPMEVKVLDGNSGKVLATQKGGVLEPCEN
ncbi:conserved hypothetical protein [Tenacibaculum finnmarkense]|nr:conserved hypothetical protein [Tenacibaculum finnmarkense]